MKILHMDCETTGLDKKENGIIQLALIIEVDGVIVGEHDFRMQPFPDDQIDANALEVHGISREEIAKYPPAHEVYPEVCNALAKHIDKYDKTDKAYPAGYNVRFDIDFVAEWFRKNGDPYFGSWQNWRCLDPLPYLYLLDHAGILNLPNYKLETVCAHFGIEITAHDALSDVRATREILNHIVLPHLPVGLDIAAVGE